MLKHELLAPFIFFLIQIILKSLLVIITVFLMLPFLENKPDEEIGNETKRKYDLE